ncbi:MAG: crossover junction endodeoxyribonuclease RuvC [Dehalococcoidia bacterium]|nr:crossover junction endodeoxyribonuclease RuvC [Dehalococcoidia bacterium]
MILGIDPGTRYTGWGVITLAGSEPRALACDVIAPKSRLPLERRLEHIFSELGDVIARFQPTVMAVEEPFVGANVRSAMAVGEARTVAILAATLAGLPVCHYAPARIKASVAGYGQGEKAQVREMLRLQLGMAEPPADLNASDALAVALCHAVQHRAAALLAGAR